MFPVPISIPLGAPFPLEQTRIRPFACQSDRHGEKFSKKMKLSPPDVMGETSYRYKNGKRIPCDEPGIVLMITLMRAQYEIPGFAGALAQARESF